MKTIQQLKSLGFKSFYNQMKPNHHSSWQLRVRDEGSGDTLYFINVYLTDYNDLPYSDQLPDSLKEDLRPEYDVQFNNEHGTFDVAFFGGNKKVEDALLFYKDMFVSMKCFDYEE